MTCDSCLHQFECMEQRGICTEFKTLEEVREEIESINTKYGKTAAVGAGADKGGDHGQEDGDAS